jgi:integrase/recombinase XerD
VFADSKPNRTQRSCRLGHNNTNKKGVGIMTNLRTKMKHEMILRGLSPNTQVQYLNAVKKLYDHYKCSPAKLTEQEIKSFLLSIIASKSYAASSYNVMIHGLNFLYRKVLRRPITEIDLPRQKEPKKLPDILSISEVERIIKATTNLKHRTILTLIYGAGLRVSGVITLTVKDIDSERSLIHIREAKGKKDRYVILSALMLKMLRNYWRKYSLNNAKYDSIENNQKEDRLIFRGRQGKPLAAISITYIYNTAKKIAGVKKYGGIHALRHAFATHSLEAGMDLYTLKELLGHSSIASTVRYLRMTNRKLEGIKSPVDYLNL